MMRQARAIERRLRERIRPMLRASPPLWAEYKKAKRASRPPLAAIIVAPVGVLIGVPVFFIGWPAFAAAKCLTTGGLDYVLAASGLCSLTVVLFVAVAVQSGLSIKPTTPLLALLPVADSVIAQRALQAVPFLSLIWLTWIVMPFAATAWDAGLPAGEWAIAISFSLVQFAVSIAAGLVLCCLGPRVWYLRAWLLCMFATCLPIVVPPAKCALVADLLYFLTPGGWVAAAYSRGWLGGNPWGWLGLIPSALVLALFGVFWRVIPLTYAATETSRSERYRLWQQTTTSRIWFAWRSWRAWIAGDVPIAEEPLADEKTRRPTIDVRSFTVARELFVDGWMNWLGRRLLSRREYTIAEWAGPGAKATASANRALYQLVIASFLLELTGWVRFSWLGLAAGALSLGWILQQVRGGFWPGFAMQPYSGLLVPYYLSVPIDFRNMARAMCKHSYISLLPFLPAFAVAAVCDVEVMGIAAHALLAELFSLAWLLVYLPMWRSVAYIAMQGGMFLLPWRLAHYTIAALLLGFVHLITTMPAIALPFMRPGVIPLPILFGSAGASIVSSYLLWMLCSRAEAKGYCAAVPLNQVLDATQPAQARQGYKDWHQDRRSNRDARRERYGRFWWLPRYMMEAKAEQVF